MRQLANLYNTIQSALAGAERVFEILDTEPETRDVPDALALNTVRGEVRFDNVQFAYQPERPILSNRHANGSDKHAPEVVMAK